MNTSSKETMKHDFTEKINEMFKFYFTFFFSNPIPKHVVNNLRKVPFRRRDLDKVRHKSCIDAQKIPEALDRAGSRVTKGRPEAIKNKALWTKSSSRS